MQPRSWSPSHPPSPTLSLPRSFSFSIHISQNELSLPAASIYKYRQFTPLVLWSSGVFRHTNFKVPGLLFPSKNVLLCSSLSSSLALCRIFAFFFILLTVSLSLPLSLSPPHSNPLLSLIFPFLSPSLAPWTLSNTGKNTQRQIHRGKHREGEYTHTHTHLPPPIHSPFLSLSPLPLQI